VLVIAGDLVYPTASREEYQTRFVAPFTAALPQTDPPSPDYFALPGNHDWYDGLVSFTRLFCNGRWLGGWRPQQTRSYFALQLPRGWWLLGADMQLDSDIDAPQLALFRRVAQAMAPTDRVILCGHYPHWIYAKWYQQYDDNINENNLAFLDDKILGGRIRVFVAGHLHFYCRHEASDGRQKITSGGGGAFLHPTHAPDMQHLSDGFTLSSAYPPMNVSRRLCWRNCAFLLRNPWFGVVPGLLYALMACAVGVNISGRGPAEFGLAFRDTLQHVLSRPGASFVLVVLVGGVVLFTDTRVLWYRLVAGTLHALSHVAAAFGLAWLVSAVLVNRLDLPFDSIGFSAGAGAAMLAGGWVLGSVILGLYLLVSLNVFGRHQNEAFSSLRIEEWKSFLRLRIGRDGALTIYSLGIPRPSPDGAPVRVELVEPPIVVDRRPRSP
jgi:hypothetical protein